MQDCGLVRGGIRGKPGRKRDRSLELSALAQAGDDSGDEQLLAVGVDAGVERDARGGDARADIRTAVNVDAAIDLECGLLGRVFLAGGDEIKASQTLGRIAIAGDGVEEPHIQIALHVRVPAGMRKVLEVSRDFKGMTRDAAPFGSDAQGAQKNMRVLQVERGLQGSVHRQRVARHGAGEIEIADADFDAIGRGRTEGRGYIMHDERGIVGRKVEWRVAVLIIEAGVSAVVVDVALFDRNTAGVHLEQGVDGGRRRGARPARMRHIRGSVGIDDEVQAGPVNLKAAQANAGTEKIAQTENHAQAIDFCVGSVAGIFKTVNNDPVGFGFKMQQVPVEGRNLRPAARDFFERRGETPAHRVFKRRRTGHEIEADGQDHQEESRECNGERKMAQEEAAQTAADTALRALRLEDSSPAMGVSSSRSSAPPFRATRAGWRLRCRRRLRDQIGIEYFHVALLAQVGEPVVEQHVDLLLQQDFLNARRYLIERWNGFAGRILRQQRVVVVGVNLLRGDLNALPETLLNEAQNLQAVAEIGLDALRREPMRREKCLPSRIGGAVLADADGQFRADLMQARIDFLWRGLDGFMSCWRICCSIKVRLIN